MQISKIITPLEIADKTLLAFDDNIITDIDTALNNAGFTYEIIDQYELNRQVAHSKLILSDSLRYIEPTGNGGNWFLLTELGRIVKQSGGHFEYIKKLEKKNASENERQNLNDEKLRYDVKNSKRIFKTYWFTFWFSVIGLGISLTLGVLKLLEVFQHTPVK